MLPCTSAPRLLRATTHHKLRRSVSRSHAPANTYSRVAVYFRSLGAIGTLANSPRAACRASRRVQATYVAAQTGRVARCIVAAGSNLTVVHPLSSPLTHWIWSCLMTRLQRAGSGRLTKSEPRVARACTVVWQKPREPCATSRTPTPRVSLAAQLQRLQVAPRIVTERQSAKQQRWPLGKMKAVRQFSLSRPSPSNCARCPGCVFSFR